MIKILLLVLDFILVMNHCILLNTDKILQNPLLIVDTGYTEGYKNKTHTKTPGARTHFFAKFYSSLFEGTSSSSDLEVNLQHVSNSTYPKINKLQTSLVDYLDNTIKNSVDYGYQNKDLFLIQGYPLMKIFQKLETKDLSLFILRPRLRKIY